MAAAVGALHVDLGLNSAQFHTGIAKAQGALSGFARHAGTIGTAIGLAVAAIPAAFATGLQAAANTADEMGKAAQKVGLTTEELSKLKYAAGQSGLSFEQLQGGLIKLTKSMSETAKTGTGPAAEAFKILGINVKNADGSMKTSSEVTSEIASKFSGFKDGVNKTALALALFGKAGADMIPFLNAGGDGIDALKKRAADLGLVISKDTFTAAEKFNDAMSDLGTMLGGMFLTILEKLSPYIVKIADAMFDAATQGKLFDTVAEGVKDALISLANFASITVMEFRTLAAAIRMVGRVGEVKVGPGMLDEISKEYEAFREEAKAAKEANDSFQFSLRARSLTIPGGGRGGNRDKEDAPAMRKIGEAGKDAAAKMTEAEKEISSAYQKLKGEAQSLYESTRTPMEAYTDQIAKLNEMLNPKTVDGKSHPLISLETYARGATAAQEKLNKAIIAGSEVAGIMQSNFNSMFDSFLSGSFNAQEAIKKLLQDILKMMMNKAIMQILSAAFNEGGPLGSLSWLGIGKNANGTNNWRGGLSLVGERGPELVNMPRGSQVIPNRALQGKASAPVVNVINNNGSQVQTETRNGPNGPELFVILDGWFADRMQKNAGPAKVMQNMFGLRRGAGKAR